MNGHRYRRYHGNRRNAGSNTSERTVEKVVDYVFFVLPRLVFWYTVKFIATTLWRLTALVATNVTRLVAHRVATKDTPEIAPSPPADTVTAQLRAQKRRQRSSTMNDWDHEWERLLDSRPDRPAGGVGVSPEQHKAVNEESSDEHVSNVPDDELREVRQNQGNPSRDAGDGSVAPKRIPSNRAHMAQAEPGELLSLDPRTMWAWAEYLEGRLSLPVSDDAARQILAAIPPGDHVEIFGAVALGAGLLGGEDTLPPGARFAARTFDRWILPSSEEEAEIFPASRTRHYATATPVYVARWMAQSNFALADGRHLGAYSDRTQVDRFDEGAGQSILRLPDNPLAPAPPGLGAGDEDALVADYIKSVTDRVRTAQGNYGANEARLALQETYGENKARLSRAENYLKGAVEALKRHPRIGAETHKAVVSHFRNADLMAAFFCLALGLPYPGDKPLSRAPRHRPTAADFY
jgi:hypothetical protein